MTKGTGKMNETLFIIAFFGGWIALQMWILPRFGVKT